MLGSLKTESSIAEISKLGACDHCRKIASKNLVRMIQSYCSLKAGIMSVDSCRGPSKYLSNRNPFPHGAGCFVAGKELFLN